MRKLLLVLLLTAPLFAQSTKTATLTWKDTANPSGTTYTIYKAPGSCTATPVFAKLASGVAVLTYNDTVGVGTYCYQVTANFGGAESSPSNSAQAAVNPFPPQTLQITVQ